MDRREDFSLVRDDPPFRWHRRVGLVPRSGGLGVGRRAIFWTAVAWLPVAVWAWSQGSTVVRPGHAPEPLLQHFGVNARLLLGIPLLIVADAVAHRILARLIPYFVAARLVRPADVARFDAIVDDVIRLRNRATPWVIIIGLALAWALAGTLPGHLLWLPDEAPGRRVTSEGSGTRTSAGRSSSC
jgi:hypothetical protein